MLIIIQYSLTDLRRFQNNEKSYLNAPVWPHPSEEEFLRYFGSIRTRLSGGLNNWVGEPKICYAKNSVKIINLPIINSAKVKLKFRRFFFDGVASGRFELGFIVSNFKNTQLNYILSEILQTEVNIIIPYHEQVKCKISDISKYITLKYIYSSSKLSHIDSFDSIKHLIKFESPKIFIETDLKDKVINSLLQRKIEYEENIRFSLSHSILNLNGINIQIWHMSKKNTENSKFPRNVRVFLVRISSLFDSLNHIMKGIINENLDIKPFSSESDILQQYLLDSLRKISLNEIKMNEDNFIQFIKSVQDNLIPGERDSLKNKLRNTINIRPQILNKLNEYYNLMDKANFFNKNINELVMINNVLNISGGNNIVNQNSSNTKLKIKNSFNNSPSEIDSQLLKQIDMLTLAINKILNKLPSDSQKEVITNYEDFEKEIKSNKPRKNKISLFLKNIKNNVKTLGEISIPIFKIIDDIIKLRS